MSALNRCLLIACFAALLAPASRAWAQTAAPAPAPGPAGPDVQTEEKPDPLKLFADFRLRIDVDTRSEDGTGDDYDDSRTRPRLRARMGLSYRTPVEGVSFGLRVATNAGTPGNSPHQTFDAGAENTFSLDRAFIKWKRQEGVTLTAGKQGWPHWQQTEIMWDEDIQPEGFLASYSRDLGNSSSIGLNAAYFYITNNGWGNNLLLNDALATWQLRWAGQFGELAPTLAITGTHLRDHADVSNTDGMHVFGDVNFFMGSAQIKTRLSGATPIKLQAGVDVITSDAEAETIVSDDRHNLGFVGQLRVGYDRYGLRYYFYSIGDTSVPFWSGGTFTQDNFPNSRGGGLAGFTGHRIQLDAKIGDGVSADFRAYLQTGNEDNATAFAETPGRSINRYQLNINAKF